MDSVNATSIEKMIADFEVIRLVKAALTPFEVNEETLCLDDIKEQAHIIIYHNEKNEYDKNNR